MDAAQKVRRSPRLNRKRRVRYEGYREASKHTVAGISLRSNDSNFSTPDESDIFMSSTSSSSTSTKSDWAPGGVVDLTKDERDALSNSKSDHNTKFDTLLATMTQCAKVLASFKRSVIAYRDSAVEFNAKLQVAATEIGESPATFREEIAYLIIDVEARDDEIARLKKENDQLKNEKAEIVRLVQRNVELESMDRQAARLRELEDWRK